MDNKTAARNLLRRSDLGVLATASPQGPLCSLMAFAMDEAFGHLFLATVPDSRKWRNIEADPRISLLVDDRTEVRDPERITALTICGRHEPPTPEDRAFGLDRLRRRHGCLAPLLDRPDVVLIRMRPQSFLLLHGPVAAVYFTELDATDQLPWPTPVIFK